MIQFTIGQYKLKRGTNFLKLSYELEHLSEFKWSSLFLHPRYDTRFATRMAISVLIAAFNLLQASFLCYLVANIWQLHAGDSRYRKIVGQYSWYPTKHRYNYASAVTTDVSLNYFEEQNTYQWMKASHSCAWWPFSYRLFYTGYPY